jgi:hypothetical protein
MRPLEAAPLHQIDAGQPQKALGAEMRGTGGKARQPQLQKRAKGTTPHPAP